MKKRKSITKENLINFMDDKNTGLIFPGTYEWQNSGCYTAFRNYPDLPGCELAENKNPVKAVEELYMKIKFRPAPSRRKPK